MFLVVRYLSFSVRNSLESLKSICIFLFGTNRGSVISIRIENCQSIWHLYLLFEYVRLYLAIEHYSLNKNGACNVFSVIVDSQSILKKLEAFEIKNRLIIAVWILRKLLQNILRQYVSVSVLLSLLTIWLKYYDDGAVSLVVNLTRTKRQFFSAQSSCSSLFECVAVWLNDNKQLFF